MGGALGSWVGHSGAGWKAVFLEKLDVGEPPEAHANCCALRSAGITCPHSSLHQPSADGPHLHASIVTPTPTSLRARALLARHVARVSPRGPRQPHRPARAPARLRGRAPAGGDAGLRSRSRPRPRPWPCGHCVAGPAGDGQAAGLQQRSGWEVSVQRWGKHFRCRLRTSEQSQNAHVGRLLQLFHMPHTACAPHMPRQTTYSAALTRVTLTSYALRWNLLTLSSLKEEELTLAAHVCVMRRCETNVNEKCEGERHQWPAQRIEPQWQGSAPQDRS